jgi:GH15 family glucan-1,4-alpha-glucosidase
MRPVGDGKANGYLPISDYAAIGNLRAVALVSREASIDWCCFPHMDSPSVFASLLDRQRGGRFVISLAGGNGSSQQYIEDTNVLVTRLRSSKGTLSITDFMPLFGDINGCGKSNAPSEIHRILRCEGGRVEVLIEWSPRFDYARSSIEIRRVQGGWLARGDSHRMNILGFEGGTIGNQGGPVLEARIEMRGGEVRTVVSRWDSDDTGADVNESLQAEQETAAIWTGWAHSEEANHAEEWTGKWLPEIIRSELALKLMTHADNGSIVAAPTTSLPETIKGIRNWDYRYTWIRDGALTVQALTSLGHWQEAIELLRWMVRVSESSERRWKLQIMYGLHGETELDEHELSHLEGYKGSQPVRIGNGAAKQTQHEVYGEVLITVYELSRRGITPDAAVKEMVRRLADLVCTIWQQPDHGIWEVRGEKQHFTYSKVMLWVSLDRAIRLAEEYGIAGDVAKWIHHRDRIRNAVLQNGYDEDRRAFVSAFGSRDLDAANLRLPLLEFLPADDKRIQGTIDRTLHELTDRGLVYRYIWDDGLPGKEGAFGLCTFWLVDALAMSGRVDEAGEIFEGIAGRANHVGLLSEQIDPSSGDFLGNFPQAFTHIGLIDSLLYLAYAEGRPIPEHTPRLVGSGEDTADRRP